MDIYSSAICCGGRYFSNRLRERVSSFEMDLLVKFMEICQSLAVVCVYILEAIVKFFIPSSLLPRRDVSNNIALVTGSGVLSFRSFCCIFLKIQNPMTAVKLKCHGFVLKYKFNVGEVKVYNHHTCHHCVYKNISVTS